MKTINVTIDPLGRPKIEAVGYNGVGCEAATASIEKALAGSIAVDRVLKDEWHASPTAEQTQELRAW